MRILLQKLKRSISNVFLKRNPPKFIIVGAQKSGTSSLFYYLSQHPKLTGSKKKELDFFSFESEFEKGEKYYINQFPKTKLLSPRTISFEATPKYLYWPKVPRRIYDFNRDMKIIIILREPVARAYSAWNMYRDIPVNSPKVYEKMKRQQRDDDMLVEYYGAETFPSFKEVVEKEITRFKEGSKILEPSVIRRGIYFPQIQRYHDLFGKEQVLILGMGELRKDKIKVLNKVLNFVGEKESDWSFLNEEPRNVRSYTDPIEPMVEKKLQEFFEPHNEALFQYLGKKVDW